MVDADVLAMQGARASSTILKITKKQDNSLPAR